MNKDVILGLLSLIAGIVTVFVQVGSNLFAFIFGIVAILLCFIFFYKVFVKVAPVIDVKKHPFWPRLDYFITYKVPNLHIVHPLRKKLFTTALITQFTVIKEFANLLISKSGFDDSCARNLIINIVKTYESKWLEEGIPPLFVKKFNEYHSHRLSSIIHYIEFICVSTFYPDESDKKVAILDGLLLMIQWTLLDIEQVDNAINGNLTATLEFLHQEGKF